ncbi:hypothetical protein BDV18DRAFT_147874 [Aspergillus unguis]
MTSYTNPLDGDGKSLSSKTCSAESISSPSQLYHIYHTHLRYNYRVSDAEKKPVYYVYNSHFKPSKPDLTFHAGQDSNTPVVGVCKLLHLSRHMKVGLGNPQRPGAMVWEDLRCQNVAMTKYRWPMSIRSPHGGLERRWFLWKRTHSVSTDGDSPSFFSLRNYKLIDEMTGQVVAIFSSNSFKSVRKSGKLQLSADHGPDFSLMALITLLAIYEETRRRRHRAGRGAGGGGGGG